MEGFLIARLIFVSFGVGFVSGNSETLYFGVGQSLTLKPPSSTDRINSVLWSHEGNIVAEWTGGEVTVYENYRGRTTLNTTNGYLEIRDTKQTEVGKYSVDINNLLHDNMYDAVLIQEVSKPNVWVKPESDHNWLLNCEGNTTNAGPVTFFWQLTEDASWVRMERRITLSSNNTMKHAKMLRCKIVNKLGEKESDPKENPFYKEEPGSSALGALALLLIIPILAIVAYLKRDYLKKLKFCGGSETTGNAAVDPNNDPSNTPLTDKTAN